MLVGGLSVMYFQATAHRRVPGGHRVDVAHGFGRHTTCHLRWNDAGLVPPSRCPCRVDRRITRFGYLTSRGVFALRDPIRPVGVPRSESRTSWWASWSARRPKVPRRPPRSSTPTAKCWRRPSKCGTRSTPISSTGCSRLQLPCPSRRRVGAGAEPHRWEARTGCRTCAAYRNRSTRPDCSDSRNCNMNLDDSRWDRPGLDGEAKQARGIPRNLQLDETAAVLSRDRWRCPDVVGE